LTILALTIEINHTYTYIRTPFSISLSKICPN
jgi:hypothetical protein